VDAPSIHNFAAPTPIPFNHSGAYFRMAVLVAEAGRPLKGGTEANKMADWILGQELPVTSSVICARFGISPETLKKRRRVELEALGIERHRLPRQGNTQGYGSQEQWRRIELVEGNRYPTGIEGNRSVPVERGVPVESPANGQGATGTNGNRSEGSVPVENPVATGDSNRYKYFPPYGGDSRPVAPVGDA
jgi:hypothetical protein